MSLKDTIVTSALELGFSRCVIGELDPFSVEKEFYLRWLENGHNGTMNYLSRDPELRCSPKRLQPEARSVIILSVSYYSEAGQAPSASYGKVATYAVGRDYHIVLKEKLELLEKIVAEKTGKNLNGKAFSDDVQLYEQALAARSGLGFSGKNSLIIGPKLEGSYAFVCELFTDLELDADIPYNGTCGKCIRCATACPTEAIESEGVVNARLCISYLTIENKGPIPFELREKLGSWVFGCDICQQVCPYNQAPPLTPWRDFLPESGVGHYLNLLDLLKIESAAQFKAQFGHTPLARPKRQGLLRNALVVLGNNRCEDGIENIFQFAGTESNPELREQAGWALAKISTSRSKSRLEALQSREPDPKLKKIFGDYLNGAPN